MTKLNSKALNIVKYGQIHNYSNKYKSNKY